MFRLAKIGGITINIHFTFGLIVAWGVWQGSVRYHGLLGATYGLLYIALLFGPILLHELGHSLVARGYGLRVESITLLPIGGLSQLESTPSSPIHEMVIALSGPLSNLGAAVVLGGIISLIQPFTFYNWADYLLFLAPPSTLTLLHYLFWVNVVLFFFNMLPAFPMDGGRVVRAALTVFSDYQRGTRIAAWIGRLSALGLLIYWAREWWLGVKMPDLLLLSMAPIIFFGAQFEDRQVRRRRALLQLDARTLCRMADTLAPWDVVTPQIVKSLRRGAVIPVLSGERMMGLLTYTQLQESSPEADSQTAAHLMQVDFPSVHPHDSLWGVLKAMNHYGLDALPVIEDEEYFGIVHADDLNRAWQFMTRRKKTRQPVTTKLGDSFND